MPEPNPVTRDAHRREFLWQVTIPMILGGVLILALAVGVTLGQEIQVTRWAEVSVIWLVLPALFIGLVFLILTGALLYGVLLLNRKLPSYARLAQDFFYRVEGAIKRASNKAAEPVLKANSLAAGWKAFWRRFSVRR